MNKSWIQALGVAGFLFIYQVSAAQISQGGKPMEFPVEKSAQTTNVIELPAVDNNALLRDLEKEMAANELKPFRFAFAFDVALNPDNSGQWTNWDGYNIWQLRIHSAGAYSLNLIFDRYYLPEGARLFVVGTDCQDIKGAFTSFNNKEYRKLAIEPVTGDDVLIQYEEPENSDFRGDIQIGQIAHDFVGIKSASGVVGRRPKGLSESCNVDVNCDLGNGYENQRDAVCRLVINGTELCTGTLINNTSLDGIPYLLTANHCISTETSAQQTVFLFNYESPYCSAFDGDDSRSISGSSLKANFDSLDFALVRLSDKPPYPYRPYYVGWDLATTAPASTLTIHHPQGDIKKISVDNEKPGTASFRTQYLSNSFWKIYKWEYGTTEAGSSGGPLFNPKKLLIGTLTGGSANCSSPTNDYFSKFSKQWDYRSEPAKQLKAWLDPGNTGQTSIQGYSPYSGAEVCLAETNFLNTDTHTNGMTGSGYWAGTNPSGTTSFAEKFSFADACTLEGVSVGIAKVKPAIAGKTSMLKVQVFDGTDYPGNLLYSSQVDINGFYVDAMNYIPFTYPIETSGNFFVAFSLENLGAKDSLSMYIASPLAGRVNTMYLKQNGNWTTFADLNSGKGSSILMEIVACGFDTDTISEKLDEGQLVKAYPNPVGSNGILTIITSEEFDLPEQFNVYDLLGRAVKVATVSAQPNVVRLDFSGLRSGIYVVKYQIAGKSYSQKVSYLR
jgi:hypothetical protein